MAVFFEHHRKIFEQRWLSPPRKNWPIRLWSDIASYVLGMVFYL